MFQEGEVKYCPTTREVFFKHYTHNYNIIKEKLPLLENLDLDAIHDIRVISRKNRALFREFKDCIPPKVMRKCCNEMKSVTRLLGQRRELDVIRQLIISLKDKNPDIIDDAFFSEFLVFLDKKREKEKTNCYVAKKILDNWINTNVPGKQIQFSNNFCIYLHAKKRIFLRIKKIKDAFKIIRDKKNPLDKKNHQFRIMLKKTRYIMEIYYNIYEKSINKWLTSFKEVQTQLGEWNDYRILLTEIEGYTDKKEFFKNNINIERIQNYINELIVQKLEQSKKIMEEYLTNNFINKTKMEIKEVCKMYKCMY